jgi:hypothetical protein
MRLLAQNNAMLRRMMTIKVFWLSIASRKKESISLEVRRQGKPASLKIAGFFIAANGNAASRRFVEQGQE